jgi:hypothetical protein
MELARALRPRAPADGATDEAASGDPATAMGRAKGRDPADAFGPLSRAIRLTLALEAKTDAELRDLKAGLTRARAEERAHAAERARIAAAKDREARIERVRDLVLNVADAEIEDNDAFDNIYDALDERLELDEANLDCAGRPLRETVERLCRDLALSPDWSRWAGEGWIVDDAPALPRLSMFTQPGGSLAEEAGRPPPETPTPPWRDQAGHDLE